MSSDQKGDLIVARPQQSLAIRERASLVTSVAASPLLLNTLGATILVVSGERGGAGVDTLIACIVALYDRADMPIHVVELGMSRGHLAASLGGDEYSFVSVAAPDMVADLITALANVRDGVPMILSVHEAAFKDFVAIEEELRLWIDQAPERYRVLVQLGPHDETSRAADYYRSRGGRGQVVCCFTQPELGLRGRGSASTLRHKPDAGMLQVPRLARRLQDAFYKRHERISSAMAGASVGEATLFTRAMQLFAQGLEDVL